MATSTAMAGERVTAVATAANTPASFRYSSAFQPRIMKCVFCYDTRLREGKPPTVSASLCCDDSITDFGMMRKNKRSCQIPRSRYERHPFACTGFPKRILQISIWYSSFISGL